MVYTFILISSLLLSMKRIWCDKCGVEVPLDKCPPPVFGFDYCEDDYVKLKGATTKWTNYGKGDKKKDKDEFTPEECSCNQ